MFSSHHIHAKLPYDVQNSAHYVRCPLFMCPLLGDYFIEFWLSFSRFMKMYSQSAISMSTFYLFEFIEKLWLMMKMLSRVLKNFSCHCKFQAFSQRLETPEILTQIHDNIGLPCFKYFRIVKMMRIPYSTYLYLIHVEPATEK